VKHIWLSLTRWDLETERLQCEQEGRYITPLAEEFARVEALDLDLPENQAAAEALLDATIAQPLRPNYPYHEPSDLEGIRQARPAARTAPGRAAASAACWASPRRAGTAPPCGAT
jgi:hypothetical protein